MYDISKHRKLTRHTSSAKIQRRRRGTAIVEMPEGILIVAGSSGRFLLPGGAANKYETRLEAAVRELREETGLRATSVQFLFRHLSGVHKMHSRLVRDDHKIYLIRVDGQPHAKNEIKQCCFYKPGDAIEISKSTRFIIDSFLALKKSSIVDKAFLQDSKHWFDTKQFRFV